MEENKKKKNNDDIIKLLCYLAMFVLLLFIILPPLFRVLFPVEEEIVVPQDKLIMNLTCVRTENFVDYEIKTTIKSTYIESKISNSIFTYEIEYTDEIFAGEDVIIEEYETLKKVNNVDFKEDNNKYTLTIDYDKFDYTKEELLIEHQQLIIDQLTYYTADHFECKTTQIQ